MATSKKHLNTSYSNVSKRIGLEARFNTLETKVDGLGTKIDNLSIKVSGLEIRVGNLELKVDNLEQRVARIEQKLIEHDSRFDILEERTALIPKLYDNIDKLIGEIIESRNDRTIVNSKLGNYEKRISRLESRR